VYEDFYGLRERAFVLIADPRFLLLTVECRENLTMVQYTLRGQAGLALLLGEVGTGKTTLLRAAVEELRDERDSFVILDNPLLTRAEFFEFLARGFRLGPDTGHSKTRTLSRLKDALVERRRGGGRSALIVDEAQSLADELLEEVRLLTNLESDGAKLLPILLAGHPDLADRLDDPRLSPLRQRVELRGVQTPLSLKETADYIAGRLQLAGGDITQTFTRPAVEVVFEASGGSPGTINVICENALVSGVAMAARPVDRDIVLEVCRDLDLEVSTPPPEREGRVPAERGASAARQEAARERMAAPAAPPARASESSEEPPRGQAPVLPTGTPAPARSPVTAPPPTVASAAPTRRVVTAADAPSREAERPVASPAPAGPRVTPGLLSRAMALLPLPRSRPRASVRLEVQHFRVGGTQGILVTPAGRGR
jgi:general secretion pathway protein A